MKPVAFDYEKPDDLGAALKLLREGGGTAKVLAGGQSLGPMLNMRLAQPRLLVDVRYIEDLTAIAESHDSVTYGSCTTHAEIEDGEVPDATRGLMRHVAAGIAYRAVRNCGTLGGSLCHADPAADWVNLLPLLGAVALIEGPRGRRDVPAGQFMIGAFATVLEDDELLAGIRVPKLSARARWGHHKLCRKPGEFGEAIGTVLDDPDRGVCRAVIGAIGGPPHVIEDARFLVDTFDADRALGAIDAAGAGDDPYERQLHYAALRRASAKLGS